jgi:hypothetical protein
MKPISTQTVAVYRNRQSGIFRVQPYARVGAGSQPFGNQTVLHPDATDEELLSAVLANLAKNDKQTYSLANAPVYAPEERRRILKEEQLMHVERSGGGYRLIPFAKMGNSFGSVDDMATALTVEDFENQGGGIIRHLFQQVE